MWDFPDQWSGAFSVNPFNLFIGECATYTAKDLVAPGYESVVSKNKKRENSPTGLLNLQA